MALTTTIGGASSDSYITLAEWATYATAQRWTLTGDDAAKEAYLRRAALALDVSYRWVGYPQYQTQKRAWPRLWTGLVDGWPINPDTIPEPVKDAQAELAYIIMGGVDPLETFDGVLGRTRDKVDVIEEEREYIGGKGRSRFTAVDRLVSHCTAGGVGGSVPLLRA